MKRAVDPNPAFFQKVELFHSPFTFSHEEDRKTYARIINTSLSAFLENSLPFFSSGDTSLQRIVSPEVSLSYEGKYFREDSTIPLSVGETFDDAHFYLSSEFKDKLSLLTFMYNGAVISLEDIPSDEIVFFDSSVRSNPYLYRYSTPTLYTIAKEQHAYGRFYTRDASQADTLATQLSKQENLFVKKIPQKKQITKYGKPTNVVMDISSRISNLFILLATIGGFVLILFLVRLLLSRFYYRKDSDEKVLNDIGYTGKDLYLNNSLQFVFLMAVSVLVCHLVFTFTIPHFIDYYVMHPALFVIAILLSLAVAFFVSMPTRKHKRKERRHD